MATITPTVTAIPNSDRFAAVVWTPLTQTGLDDGLPQGINPGFDRSVQIQGTFGTGGTVVIEGSNEATPASWQTLRDPQGNSLSFTAAGLKQVLEWTRWIRPRVTGGDGTTSITVSMILGR